MNRVQIKIITKDDSDDLIPIYATDSSAGADLKADILDDIELLPHESVLIPTGIFVEIPKNFEIQIRPRSSLALKHKVTVLNSPGTIDQDYRGEIKVILINHSNDIFKITKKMRIAQMIIAPIYRAKFIKVKKLSLSNRGEGGFGHTGTH